MKITHSHSFCSEKYTTNYHQVHFLIAPTFVRPGGTSKGPSSDSSNNPA